MFWRSRSPLERCFSSKCLVMRDDTVPLPEPGAPMITARSSRPDAPMVTDGGPSCADAGLRPGLHAHGLHGPSELAAASGRWPGRQALPEVSAGHRGRPARCCTAPPRPCTPLPSAPPRASRHPQTLLPCAAWSQPAGCARVHSPEWATSESSLLLLVAPWPPLGDWVSFSLCSSFSPLALSKSQAPSYSVPTGSQVPHFVSPPLPWLAGPPPPHTPFHETILPLPSPLSLFIFPSSPRGDLEPFSLKFSSSEVGSTGR